MSWWRPIRRKLRAWCALERQERRTLVRSALLLAEIGLRLRLAGFDATRRVLERRAAGGATGPPPVDRRSDRHRETARRTAELVRMAAYQVPWTCECLPRALATSHLLSRAGIPADLRVGVRKERDGELVAHAWVELGGRPVDAGDAGSPERYAALEPAAGPSHPGG